MQLQELGFRFTDEWEDGWKVFLSRQNEVHHEGHEEQEEYYSTGVTYHAHSKAGA